MSNCDVPGYIVIKNESDGEIVYRYEIIEERGNLQTQTIEIKDNRNQNEANIMFGFGHFWTDERIKEYLSTINKIEIISSADTLLLTDKREMFDFFKERRRGLFKNVIRIEIH